MTAASDSRSGSCGRMRGAASIRCDLDVHVRIDAIEPVGDELARGLVQLGRQLGPGRAGADDGDLQLLGPQRLGLGVRADAGVDEPAVEARGLLGGLQRDGMVLDAGGAEVVASGCRWR